jgi:hypothetical protein
MMGIPPTPPNNRPSSSYSDDDKDDKGKVTRPFKLPKERTHSKKEGENGEHEHKVPETPKTPGFPDADTKVGPDDKKKKTKPDDTIGPIGPPGPGPFPTPIKPDKGFPNGKKNGIAPMPPDSKKLKEEMQRIGPMTPQDDKISQQNKQTLETGALPEPTGIEARDAVAKVSEIIQRLVTQLQIGAIGGKNFASLDLKGTEDIPTYLRNTTLNITQDPDGLIIRFSNFESPQQQALAIQAIEKNKDALQQLMQSLHDRNINVVEMQLGNHSVTLPRVEPLPPPFQAPTAQGQEQMDREGGGQQQKQGRDQEEEEPPQ